MIETSLCMAAGSWMEFGVFQGATLNGAADYRKKNCNADPSSNFVYGFDTFTGLPEAWGEQRPSVGPLYSRSAALERVHTNATA